MALYMTVSKRHVIIYGYVHSIYSVSNTGHSGSLRSGNYLSWLTDNYGDIYVIVRP